MVHRRPSARKRLTIRAEKRGLDSSDISLPIGAPEISPLAALVRTAGGAPIGAYREPLSGRPILMAALPIKAIDPTPFQRDLSPTHTKRLAQKIEESGAFLDPLIVVQGTDCRFWTPNGRHRLAAAKVLGLKQVTALLSPDADLAYRILALNTEKAHNLRDRSVEVIRMARDLARRNPRAGEADYAAQFESAEFLTLGIVYESNKRFGGGAYRPFLRKVDRFTTGPLTSSLGKRAELASRIQEIDARVAAIVKDLEARGFSSPYLKTYVVARINPVRFHRAKKGDTAPAMPISAALIRMTAAAKKFDTAKVNPAELALVAAVAGDGE